MHKFFFIFVVLSSPYLWGFHIVVDPGHGGSDTGAKVNNVKESKITLSLAKIITQQLNNLDGVSSKLTRTSNTHLNLEQRPEFANNSSADLFISIHANSSPDKSAQGAEFYFQNQLAPEEESMYLANIENASVQKVQEAKEPKTMTESILLDMRRNHNIALSAQFAESLYSKWQGRRKRQKNSIKQAPFYVINNALMPSILVEVGFLTNSKERNKLSKPEYLKLLARGITKAIIDYKAQLEQK